MKQRRGGDLSERAFISLDRALHQPLCCICRLVREMEEQHIWFFLYEHTADPPLRRRFDETSGFCHYHGHLAARIVREREMMSESAVSQVYETVVMTYREQLQEASRGKRGHKISMRGGKLPGAASADGCMVCEASRHAVAGSIAALLRLLQDENHRLTYVRSDGLCNSHLALALRKAEADARRFLLEDQERRMAGLQRRLSELQRKHSYDVQETPSPDERDSWAEAIWRFTGVSWGELLVRREDAKAPDRAGRAWA